MRHFRHASDTRAAFPAGDGLSAFDLPFLVPLGCRNGGMPVRSILAANPIQVPIQKWLSICLI